MARRSRLANPSGWSRKISSADSRAWLRCWPRRSPGTRVPGVGGDRVGEGVQVAGSGDRVVVESLDAQQAPVGFEADLPQRGQIHKTFPDVEVAGVVDGGLGP